MKLFFHYFKRYGPGQLPSYLAGILCLLMTNWLAVQIPMELARGVDALAVDQLDAVKRSAWMIAGMGAAVILVRTLSRVLIFTPGRWFEHKLRCRIFDHLLHLSLSEHRKHVIGDLISRASNDISSVRVMYGFGILQIFNVTLALTLTGREMLSLSPSLTLIVTGPILLSVALVQAGTRRLIDLSRSSMRIMASISDEILTGLQGLRSVQGFRAEPAFLERFDQHNEAYLQNELKISHIQALVLPILWLGGALGIWGLIRFGGPMISQGQLTAGELIAFVGLLGYLLSPLRSLGWMISVFQRGVTALERIHSILLMPREPDSGQQLPAEPPAFELRDLSFSYPDSAQPSLEGLRFTLPAGASLGVFGRTGSGKSTLLRLLARSLPVSEGSIFVSGLDLSALDLKLWRSMLGPVWQRPFLFSQTVRENIELSQDRPDYLRGILEAASLSQDLGQWSEGLDTQVGERGITLSGGQKQRVALARALYRDSQVLLLDDTLSAVDFATEQQIIPHLKLSGEGPRPTVVLVSHRLSALAHCDHILVLDGGRQVDWGTHEELLARPGLYRDAWQEQEA